MRQRCLIVILMGISLGGVAQKNSVKSIVSAAPLTTEQIAVYRAVLMDYLKESDGVLNLANITEPIGESEKTCFSGMDTAAIGKSAPVIHRIEAGEEARDETAYDSADWIGAMEKSLIWGDEILIGKFFERTDLPALHASEPVLDAGALVQAESSVPEHVAKTFIAELI